MAYLEKYSNEHYWQAGIFERLRALDAAPDGAHLYALRGYKYSAPAEMRRSSNDPSEKVLALRRKVCFGPTLACDRSWFVLSKKIK